MSFAREVLLLENKVLDEGFLSKFRSHKLLRQHGWHKKIRTDNVYTHPKKLGQMMFVLDDHIVHKKAYGTKADQHWIAQKIAHEDVANELGRL